MELAEIKQVKPEDLWEFLVENHKQFSVLNVSLKSILSTKRTSITLSKNSVRSFYKKEPKISLSEKVRMRGKI